VVPNDLRYDLEADVWVRLEDRDGRVEVVVGMTDVAQTRGGRLVQVGWKRPGSRVVRGRPLAIIESAKWVGPMRSPLTGVILATNEAEFTRDVAVANRDPYGRGWFCRISPSALDAEVAVLADADQAFEHYRQLIEAEGITCIRCAD
jgi:glycine cleavage system H protein